MFEYLKNMILIFQILYFFDKTGKESKKYFCCVKDFEFAFNLKL